ncbi:MAG: hypothetical protein ACUVXG_13020 [Anaerolineae bacterium]
MEHMWRLMMVAELRVKELEHKAAREQRVWECQRRDQDHAQDRLGNPVARQEAGEEPLADRRPVRV